MLSAQTPKPTAYQLDAVWPAPAPTIQEEVARFWLAESALPDRESARQRAPQLLVVARDADGHVAGVSTAVRTFVPRLGFDCFFYRTFVGRRHRTRGLHSTQLYLKILLHSRRFLNERFVRGCDSDVLGLYVEVENRSVLRNRNEAVWQDSGVNFVYIGKTSDGRHIRVWYFDNARIG